MAKDKKKKDKGGKKKDKLKSLAQNPLVADVVAAALVATAAALKDSKRAHALASDAADELTKLSKSSSKTGSAMWQLALQVGRQSLEALLDGGKADGDGERDRKQAVASKSPPKAKKVSAKRGKASDAA